MRTAVIGGGAAGFFLAINLKEQMPEMEVTIFERSQRVLAKVEISGGGRCNCTNSFRQVGDLSTVYPRGHRLMKRLFHEFSPQDAYRWFERHGVPLVTQDDECVFPAAQDSHAIIDCFLSLARRYGIRVLTGRKIQSLDEVRDYDFVAVTTGGSPKGEGLRWLAEVGHEIEQPVPSLFTLNIEDRQLRALMGAVTPAEVHLVGTKMKAEGPLLITHWGMSGPAILKLSSYGARYLADHDYRAQVSVRWGEASAAQLALGDAKKMVVNHSPVGLSQRLWTYLAEKALGERSRIRWGEVNRKDVSRLENVLTNDTYDIVGRAPFKDEFVTCGGVSLRSINPSTMESRHVKRLFLAGEVLDVDGVTGGFNFQAAWTTAFVAASSIRSLALQDDATCSV